MSDSYVAPDMQYQYKEAQQIIRTVIRTLEQQVGQSLQSFCPNHMLWEAIRKESSVLLSWKELPKAMEGWKDPIFLFPEPLSYFYCSQNIPYKALDHTRLMEAFREEAIEINGRSIPISNTDYREPLYFIDADLTHMLALTAENTADGSQLCCIVHL